MLNTRLLLTDAAILTIVFTTYVGLTLWWRPRLWMHDFPEDIQAGMPPKTDAEKRQTIFLAIPFFILVFGGLGLTAARYGLDQPFFAIALHVYLVWEIVNLFDLLIIDWCGMHLVDPDSPPLPGTEGAKGYRDYMFHFLGFLKGSVMGTVLAPLVVFGVRVVVG